MNSAGRLGTNVILPVVADAARPLSTFLREGFDRILVDGPCSGLGTISRHPDIKRTKAEADIERLALLQKTILNQAASLLKPEGSLLYVTCTISQEENEGVVEAFLREHPGLGRESLSHVISGWGEDLVDENGFFRTLPHVHGTEGFFGALFKRS
jgi:16S rRNA (cytosine967-C5)-methyltransferase